MIRARYLDALERQRFELLPAGPYARAFLREYSEFLGLDGDVLAAEYDLRFAPRDPTPAPEPPSRISELDRWLGSAALRRGAALVAGCAIVAVLVWQLGGSTTSVTAPASTASSNASLPPVSEVAKSPRTTAAASVAAPAVLTIAAARGDCWVSVHVGAGTGARVLERTLHQGDVVRLGLHRPLWIRLGAPWNVDLRVGHKLLVAPLRNEPGDVLVTAAGLRSAG
jgi:cytoskeletal protein RodZ